ncbi:MAG: nicotinate-nucleotide--dimethylbenzimidazole phosphoribosyltransferase [Clostridiales bacterium]|nr:nicotinate-nucleotide--dimethylbenzimidazole phosphoribosyltransferase [Clostridiales bacterium]
MNFSELNDSIQPLNESAVSASQKKWDEVAKPLSSLGKLETVISQMAGIFQTADVHADKKAVIVFCADNGVLVNGVTSSAGKITAVMSEFITRGRSSVSRMAQIASADVITVDMGIFHPIETEGILNRRIAGGTADFTKEPAMTPEQAAQAIQTGISLVQECKEKGYSLIATGEMGVGNTSTSSAAAAVLTGRGVWEVTGRGVGISDEALLHKMQVIQQGVQSRKPDPGDAFDVLCKLGGFDIAGMTGAFIGGALSRLPIVIDGFISAVSALIAVKLCPKAKDFLLPSHVSAEPAGRLILDALGLEPLITAGMHLGEGTGAVCLFPLIDMALSVYHTACTFSDIQYGA